jgi:hypothetical protein
MSRVSYLWVEGHYASECPIFTKGEYVLEELQEAQNAEEPLHEEPLQEEETAQQESVDRKFCESAAELEDRLLQMSTPKSPDLHLPDSAPATYMCAKLWEASGLITGFQLPSDAAREAESAYPLVYCLMEREHLTRNDEALCEVRFAQQVFESMRRKELGRMLVSAVLHRIRAQFQKDPVAAADRLQTLSDLMERVAVHWHVSTRVRC